LRKYGDFLIFEDGGSRRVGVLNFRNCTGRNAEKVKLCHRAKCRGERSNHCGDMSIFRFFKMAAAAMFGF